MCAAGNGHVHAVRLLVQAGALQHYNTFDAKHMTALGYAAFYGHASVVRFLVHSLKTKYGEHTVTQRHTLNSFLRCIVPFWVATMKWAYSCLIVVQILKVLIEKAIHRFIMQ